MLSPLLYHCFPSTPPPPCLLLSLLFSLSPLPASSADAPCHSSYFSLLKFPNWSQLELLQSKAMRRRRMGGQRKRWGWKLSMCARMCVCMTDTKWLQSMMLFQKSKILYIILMGYIWTQTENNTRYRERWKWVTQRLYTRIRINEKFVLELHSD